MNGNKKYFAGYSIHYKRNVNAITANRDRLPYFFSRYDKFQTVFNNQRVDYFFLAPLDGNHFFQLFYLVSLFTVGFVVDDYGV